MHAGLERLRLDDRIRKAKAGPDTGNARLIGRC